VRVGISFIGNCGDEFLDILGNAAETEGRLDSCTNTEVYHSGQVGFEIPDRRVVFCVDGVSRIFKNDPEAKRRGYRWSATTGNRGSAGARN